MYFYIVCLYSLENLPYLTLLGNSASIQHILLAFSIPKGEMFNAIAQHHQRGGIPMVPLYNAVLSALHYKVQ